MLRIPSKHCQEHYESLGASVRRAIISAWANAPNGFVRPLSSDLQHVFVCGCGHSGTTLTAGRMGNHSRVFLIGRETNAFSPKLGAACSKRLVREWDYFAALTRKDYVLEKSPKHIQRIPAILRIVPEARFVITTRNPLDNVASLYKRLGDLSAATGRWLVDNKRVLGLLQNTNTHIVRYESLTKEPEKTFSAIFEFLSLESEDVVSNSVATEYNKTAHNDHMSVRASEITQPIRARIGNWRETLSVDQAKFVLKRTQRVAESLGFSRELSTSNDWASL